MTNSQDSVAINSPAWREQLAQAIATGVRSYQGVAQYKETPKLLADYRGEKAVATMATVAAVSRPAIRPMRAMSQIMTVGNSDSTRRPALSRPAGRARHR